MNYEFELIIGKEFQIEILYKLLKDRVHNISHSKVPNYDNHIKFVESHPYRKWYLVKKKRSYVGTFYIKNDNSIGLNLNNIDKDLVLDCIDYIKRNFVPRETSASMVPNYFYINVASTNHKLIKIMDELFFNQLQISYKI